MNPWLLEYEGFAPAEEGWREALCTLANGYLSTRGAAPEASADAVHYPGTYLAGCYNCLTDVVADHHVENESLVNLPNWLVLRFRVEGGPWFDPQAAELLEYHQALDLRAGVLRRDLRFRDPDGRITRVEQRRLVHMGDAHLAALQTTFTAENWSGQLDVQSLLDGDVRNDGVERYRALSGRHLRTVRSEVVDASTAIVAVETTQSGVQVAMAARTKVWRDGTTIEVPYDRLAEEHRAGHELRVAVAAGAPVTVEKTVAVFSSRDHAVSDPSTDALRRLGHTPRFADLETTHALRWRHVWQRCDISVTCDHDGGESPLARTINVHLFHLLQTVSKHSADLDVGVPARGLHGEAYRGHVFWDELFIFPYLNLRLPKLTRGLLLYRYRRLPEARLAATARGLRGALFPWQSASNGSEQTQTAHLNPLSGRWLPDASHLQRHVNAAIAFNAWQFFEVTADHEFLSFYGAELILEIARYFASAAELDPDTGRYHLRKVVGPDEYHEAYPDADEPGLDDNAYTNVMAAWVLVCAQRVLDALTEHRRAEMLEALGVDDAELECWDAVSRNLHVPFLADGVMAQFEGYGDLEELDWGDYQERFGDIRRLDRILEAQGDTPDRYQLSKQADVLMLLYLLPAEELDELLRRLGYDLPSGSIERTIEYYLARTSHGSTLSAVVHAWVLARADRWRSWDFFVGALEGDMAPGKGSTTHEGIHLGAMAGTVDLLQRCYAGVQTRDGILWLDPQLPPELARLTLNVRYRGNSVGLDITPYELAVTAHPNVGPVRLGVDRRVVELAPGESKTFSLPITAD